METKKRVLVVDDEPAVLRFVKVGLSVAGFDVVTTTNGAEAIKLAESARPDIMLVDLVMTPLTGFDVLEGVRKFSQVPVIIFTARSDIGARALQEGANAFIAKPFQPDQLTRLVTDLLAGRKPL